MKIFIFLLVTVGGILAYTGYAEHLVSFSNELAKTGGDSHFEKCIAEDGRVFYGSVPSGVVCKQIESVKGTLVIASSEKPYAVNRQERAVEKSAAYQCDGRVYCSQMQSCEEATYFLTNCPGVKMDGNNDGVPCERQWC